MLCSEITQSHNFLIFICAYSIEEEFFSNVIPPTTQSIDLVYILKSRLQLTGLINTPSLPLVVQC